MLDPHVVPVNIWGHQQFDKIVVTNSVRRRKQIVDGILLISDTTVLNRKLFVAWQIQCLQS